MDDELIWFMVVICAGERFRDVGVKGGDDIMAEADMLLKNRVDGELSPKAKWLVYLLHVPSGKFLIREKFTRPDTVSLVEEMNEAPNSKAVASHKAIEELKLFVCPDCQSADKNERSVHLH